MPDLAKTALKQSELIDALDTLGVLFLRGGSGIPKTLAPDALMAALATSPEARLRVALIPLLLAHPEFAENATEALQVLPSDAALVLRCYYTAAHWLQAKYRTRIATLCGDQPALPDLFGEELGLLGESRPDSALRSLARCQQKLSGREINWLGTMNTQYKAGYALWRTKIDGSAHL